MKSSYMILKDIYIIDARLEWRNAQWNFDPLLEFVKTSESLIKIYDEDGMKSSRMSFITVVKSDERLKPLNQYYDLPLCKAMDKPGRWIPTSKISSSQDSSPVPPVAEDGRLHVPYHCRYRTISYKEFISKGQTGFYVIHWYGDSNSRRAMQMFQYRGRFCGNGEDDKINNLACICNDYSKTCTWTNSSDRH